MIEVKNIIKKYNDQLAVNNVSFDIKEGEIVGFLGPNGAGKSTMMKIINSYLSCDSGTVRIGGKDISIDPVSSKQMVGYLPENNPLYDEMFVREYLEYVSELYKISFSEIEKVIIKTGLSKEANKKISQLSKGYKQRVGLAAAIIHNPDYLILDEPTTGLDPNQIIEIRNLIKEFGKEKTVLLSTHIMQEVEAMCDRVIIINNGKIVADKYLTDFTNENMNTCKVVFEKEIDAHLISEIEGIDLVDNNKTSYFLKFDHTNILKVLVDHAANHNNSIVEFKISDKNLEDTFRELTSRE